MSAVASWEVQSALYQLLSTDTALTTLLGGVRIYDDVPPGADFPFVAIGENLSRDWSTGSDAGDEHALTIHTWSRQAGRKQTHDLIAAIRVALEANALSLSQNRVVNLGFEFSQARLDGDGETYHGVIRYRVVTEPT
ncbi:MAG: DUF3168 domain-containing protein [Alphaproteobacteria bacterium]